jgi:hypothetical protein
MPAAASGRYTVQMAEFLRAGGLGAVAQAGCGSLAVSRSSRAYYGRHRGLMLPTRRVENPRFQGFYLPDHGQTMVGTTHSRSPNNTSPTFVGCGAGNVSPSWEREKPRRRRRGFSFRPNWARILPWGPQPYSGASLLKLLEHNDFLFLFPSN